MGSQGAIFSALLTGPRGFRRRVALKRLPFASLSVHALERCFAEVRRLAQIQHPNLANVQDFLVAGPSYYLVLELLDGCELAELARGREEIPAGAAVALIAQAAAGLACAHAPRPESDLPGGLWHGDLRPESIFVCRDGTVKILDLGLARLCRVVGEAVSQERQRGCEFLSPEQARGEAIDARSDLYQLGAVLFYLLAGRPPHSGAGMRELLENIASAEPASLARLRPDLPPGLSRLVARALGRDPAWRFPDAAGLRAAAEVVVGELGSGSSASLTRLVAGRWSSAAETEPTTRRLERAAAPEAETPAPPGGAGGDALAGRALGDFIVREKIGEGGFGAVYLADQPLLGREAVIKILHARHRSSEDLIQRFLREARLASLLDHPYAAHIYAFGAEPDGVLWLAMERVHGTTLEQLLAIQGPLPLERFVPLLERICEVVYTAHERGIVHRDLKPPNVMVLWRAGRLLPKLLDFGIAKLASEAALEERTPGGAKVALPLTAGGTRMGSPHYMAPEQWRCAASSDARADLYSLGVLTYQALTGRLPFDGETPEVLLERHRTQPVPVLGDGFPEALDGVLERALAKRPEQRYATALDYAAAFRAAAGLGTEAESLPQLDDARRQAFAAGAPQPIAEAVAAIESARNLHQARDAVWHALQTVARYLGVLALASRTRIGPLAHGDCPSTGAALRALRTRRLSDEEWLELGRELSRPFVTLREAHPVPELVSFFFLPSGEAAAGDAALGRLLEMRSGAEPAGHSELEVRELLLRALPELDRVLDSADFVRDYQLVVPRGDVGERWMGVRRASRITVRLRSPDPAGQPLLLDGAGCPVLALWPLMQVARPAPAASEELFLFDGGGRRGARLIALPFGFERHDGAAGDLLLELAPAADDTLTPLAEPPAPYRGLTVYGADDAGEFIGREREAEALIHRLRDEPLVLVVGPSGSGKSSFVQAGVIPSLPPAWQAVTLRPSGAPIAALAARLELAGIGVATPELEAMLEGRPEVLGELLRAHARARHLTLVLVIDAFEEVLALCPDSAERQRFAAALAAAARSPEDPVRVVCTLRDDFLGRVQQLPALRQRLTHSVHLLGGLQPEDLLRILVEPARRAGYAFEDDELPREMVHEVAAEPAALALLSFTAARLWELRDRHFRRLPRPAYHALGGVGGALSRHAEATLAELGPAQQLLVRDLFRQLVTSEGTRSRVARAELIQLFGERARDADEVVERLVAARLLVASEGEHGEQRIEVVHEALLSAWPRLVAWRREDAEGARLRDQLRVAARQWEERGRARGLLWRNEALTEYRLWRARYRLPLTAVEESFAAASLREAARGRRARRLAACGMVAALVLGLTVLHRQRSAAEASAKEARVRLLVGYEQEGRQAILAGDPTRGIVYLSEALSLGGESPATRFLLARATASLSHERLSIDGHTGQVYSAVFSPDGSRILTAGQDRVAKIWDVVTGRLLFQLKGHTDTIWHAEFGADGSQILTASSDGTVKTWETATGRLHFSLPHRDRVYYAAFDGPGDRLVTASDDHQARIWSADNGELLLTLSGHQGPVRNARFSRDGSQVVTASWDNTARVWDAATGKLRLTLRGHSQRVQSALFSPDGTRVLTTSFDRTAKLWDARSGALLHTLQGHLDALSVAEFSPDGARIVTASFDRTAKLWDTATGALLASLDHSGSVFSVSFSGDGGRILTVSHDGTARLWDGRKGTLLSSLVGHLDALFAGGFSPDGSLAVTASQDRKVKIWNTRPDDLVMSFHRHEAAVASAVFSRDGLRTLTAGDDRTAKIWDVRDGRALATFKGSGGLRAVAFSPNEQRPLSLDARTLAVWNGPGPTGQLPRLTATLTSGGPSPGRGWFLRLGQHGSLELREQDSGNLRWSVHGHQGAVRSADFSPDAASVVTASNDGTARVWETATGRVLETLRGHNGPVVSARFSSNGKWIATGSVDRTAKLWDAQTGGLVLSFDGHTNMVWSATVSHDGRLVATASEDGTARIWDASDGKLLMIKRGHNRAVRVAEFSPDDSRLLTASADGSAEIWDIRIDLRSPEEIRDWVGGRVPFRLVAGHIQQEGRR